MQQLAILNRTGYKYRLKKRRLAHQILTLLCRDLSWWWDPNFGPGDYSQEFSTIFQLAKQFHGVSIDDLNGAVALLNVNHHIKKNTVPEDDPNDPPEYILPTQSGREAFLEEYYVTENRKDTLEQFELLWRWVLPFFGLAAFFWQFFDHLFHKK